ncbi:thioredoxin family protein [bacterium]|nr:thioredoxin family protein [bacterium]
MKKNSIAFIFAILLFAGNSFAQGYKVGDKARDFNLKNVDGKNVSLKDYGDDVNGFIITFTCNHCPYSKAYEDRIIALDKKFAALGYPVIAINPNDPSDYPEDSFDNMIKRAREKKFTFPYLVDETQEIARTYGASRTPHMYVLQKKSGGLEVVYIGAIDDNTENADAVKNKYVEAAIDALIKGQKPSVSFTKAIGCSIKWKKS